MATALYGLLGWPVGHSVSPPMMMAAFAAAEMDGVYLPFAVHPDRIADAVRGLQALGAVGVNVTIPHKQSVYALTTDATAEATLAKAVNCLAFRSDGGISGHNTDVLGWWSAVAPMVGKVPPKQVTLLGAGGAARAVVTALALNHPETRLLLVARNPEQALALAKEFADSLHTDVASWEERHEAVNRAEWVVNSTPIGMSPNVSACPLADAGCLHPGQFVQDLIYRPSPTRLLAMAAERGCIVQDGLPMLVGQGAAAFHWWTGMDAPVDAMQRAAYTALQLG
ncbi:shikimate dehydrogenase (NADP(+)) [Alicyclobacillus contaminans]|uniref:shikimate dehydrogenase n=1 Tax=Alicyclobacillus contaminans TaxID=392016 RepID=UPI0004205479|nr:shikimate dehydrogenase [Alicyclobacillus contaminans]GMA52119.1 shikimate dehydrogenase (NADP(+)) [Alicyclobacillus contaminans]